MNALTRTIEYFELKGLSCRAFGDDSAQPGFSVFNLPCGEAGEAYTNIYLIPMGAGKVEKYQASFWFCPEFNFRNASFETKLSIANLFNRRYIHKHFIDDDGDMVIQYTENIQADAMLEHAMYAICMAAAQQINQRAVEIQGMLR